MPLQKLILRVPVLLCAVLPCAAHAQIRLDPSHAAAPSTGTPLTQPTLSPGALELLTLDGQFSQSVAKGGGAGFASWFADDGIVLNNGKPPIYGHARIAATATWKPDAYQLTWQPEYAQMGPSADMGYTWGHYEGNSKDRNGNPVKTSGRYMTVWKKTPDGKWKVALDASADEPPAAGDCCKLPNP
ncbi:YybH family protein [Terriglobus sp.]|uniref:YybH family protein n=1 Tax=Terriglobus sp. TaxID=1889013 RepID=UPI003B0052E5